MKAKFTGVYGAIEAEGTPEELARFAAAQNQLSTPFVSGFIVPTSACAHDFDTVSSLPSCRKCGAIRPSFTITTAGMATNQ